MKLAAFYLLGFLAVIPDAGSRIAAGVPAALDASITPGRAELGGYVWLDLNLEPLPFQGDAEIEEFMRTAEITRTRLIGTGITVPRECVLTRDGVSARAVFKDVEVERRKVTERTAGRSRFYLDWRDSHEYERAAYAVDRMLGIYRVPPAVARQFRGASGTMIFWIEGTITESERRARGLRPPDPTAWGRQMQIMHLFNNLIAKRDVNLGNTLVDSGWRVWFIDSTRAFGDVDELLDPESITRCERRLWARLQSLDPEEVKRRLQPHLSNSEIEAFLVRRDKILAHLSSLIDARGAEAVLFDMEPAADPLQP